MAERDGPVVDDEITHEMELAGYEAYLNLGGSDSDSPTALVRAVYAAMHAASCVQ